MIVQKDENITYALEVYGKSLHVCSLINAEGRQFTVAIHFIQNPTYREVSKRISSCFSEVARLPAPKRLPEAADNLFKQNDTAT